MPKRRDLSKFPPIFERLVRASLALSGKPDRPLPLFRHRADTPGQAQNIMLQLRQYLKLLEDAGSTPDFLLRYPHLADLAGRTGFLAIRLDPAVTDKRTLEVVHRDDLATGQAVAGMIAGLEAALGTDPLIVAAALAPPPADVAPPSPGRAQEATLAEIYTGGSGTKAP